MSKDLGQWGEARAADFLSARGYKILAQNYRSRFGEIDIIASHQGALVFVEVKARSTARFGTPAEAVTRRKLVKLQRLMMDFMTCYQVSSPIRFEVVVISKDGCPRLISDIEFVDS